ALDPPCAPITWEQVVEFSQLAEFDLLRDTGNQLHNKHWSIPCNRQALGKYFDLECSKEEIVHCNVETLRLHTKIQDDAISFPTIIEQCHESNPPLAAEIQCCWYHLQSVNTFHLSRIAQIHALPGFSGRRLHLGLGSI
ncbi:hypothetical protein EV424DRAFT_1325868, partial [Suillus variegatus]